MQLLLLVISVLCFSFVIAIIVLRIVYKDTFLINARINRLLKDKPINIIKRTIFKNNKENKKQISFINKFQKSLSLQISLSGIRLRAEEFVAIWAAVMFAPAFFAFILRVDIIACVALILFGGVAPYLYLKSEKAKRMSLFDQQLTDALIIMGNCLRSGLSFEQALNSIARDMPEPISKEFTRVSKEVKLGITMENALENMVKRIDSKDLMMVVSAVLIQRQVGGNLSEVLDSVSDTIRERLKIKTSIKVLTASGRTSGMIVGLMPVFVLGLLALINPSYIRIFFESQIGMIMLVVAICLEAIGFLAVRKIVNIKF